MKRQAMSEWLGDLTTESGEQDPRHYSQPLHGFLFLEEISSVFEPLTIIRFSQPWNFVTEDSDSYTSYHKEALKAQFDSQVISYLKPRSLGPKSSPHRTSAAPEKSSTVPDSNSGPADQESSPERTFNYFKARLLFLRQWKVYVLPRFRHKTSTVRELKA